MRALILLLALCLPAHAQAPDHPPARAEIDCGTLQGSGIVRLMIGDRVLRVNVDCGRAV
jgi:hypothetical protein